jgi:hypothetical protein
VNTISGLDAGEKNVFPLTEIEPSFLYKKDRIGKRAISHVGLFAW